MALKGNGSKILDTHRNYSGEPMKNSLAIAYAMKKKARKKMAEGGEAEKAPVQSVSPNLPGAQSAQDSMRKAFKFAEGGEVGFDKWAERQKAKKMGPTGIHESVTKSDPGTSNAGAYHGKYGSNQATSKRLHEEKYAEAKAMPKPKLQGLAEGGEVDAMDEDDKDLNQMPVDMKQETEDADDDLVMRIMRKRYSKGGQVANPPQDSDKELADFDPNNFDDLNLDDDLEFHDTEANSGDDVGDSSESERRSDIVSRIMASRKKKDRLPKIR